MAARTIKTRSRRGTNLSCDAALDAAGKGDVKRLRKYIADGFAVNSTNDRGETAVSYAAAWDQYEALKMLLRAGADPNIADKSGGTALMVAAQHASLKVIRELLKHGADENATDRVGQSVLMHALWRSDKREIPVVIRELLRRQLRAARRV